MHFLPETLLLNNGLALGAGLCFRRQLLLVFPQREAALTPCLCVVSGPNRGHYITIVKSHGFWLLFDDDIVEVRHSHRLGGRVSR